jgi:hypothetical protein
LAVMPGRAGTNFINPFPFPCTMNDNGKTGSERKIADIFEDVKEVAAAFLGTEQPGLLVGLSDLGSSMDMWLGAYYSPDANTIVLNRRPMELIRKSRPDIYNHYLFHLLLHEYIHSLGFYDEYEARRIVLEISEQHFGKDHIITGMANDIKRYVPLFTYGDSFAAPDDISIEYIPGIDRKNTGYIS